MKSDLIKKLCRIAFQTYPQADQLEHEWEKWIKKQYDSVKIFSKDNTQSIVVEFDDMIVLSFRGTEPKKVKDLKSDWQVFGEQTYLGVVHRGFLKYFNNVKNELFDHVRDRVVDGIGCSITTKPVYVTGHSLGGAAATLCAVFMDSECCNVEGVVTFGSPRVGDKEFRDNANILIEDRGLRVENNNDIVPRIPPPFNLNLTGRMPHYRHCFDTMYFDRNGTPKMFLRDGNKWSEWIQKEVDRVLGYKKGDLVGEHSKYMSVVGDMV